MDNIPEFLKRIGTDGRFDLTQKWLYGQKNLIATYNERPYAPREVFINNLINGFLSHFHRMVIHHLATIDMAALAQFENRYLDLLATVK